MEAATGVRASRRSAEAGWFFLAGVCMLLPAGAATGGCVQAQGEERKATMEAATGVRESRRSTEAGWFFFGWCVFAAVSKHGDFRTRSSSR